MRRRFKTAEYERATQEFLYKITYRFTGMPATYNYWNYPDVLLWGEDSEGNFLVPDFLVIYFNETYAHPYEKRYALERQLANHIPPKWDCYWFFGQGFIWAERREFGESSILPVKVQNMNRHAAHNYDLSLVQNNGHREVLEDGNVVFVVPQYESN
jgi:hypothetical protein